jgi:hypothetical protein
MLNKFSTRPGISTAHNIAAKRKNAKINPKINQHEAVYPF